ncbi:hypothetical protein NQZ68_013447 [Dissostichus eleginoides]|nr:hypothetical protein NQZ68_013447 [Dissostichus eleginoides]
MEGPKGEEADRDKGPEGGKIHLTSYRLVPEDGFCKASSSDSTLPSDFSSALHPCIEMEIKLKNTF